MSRFLFVFPVVVAACTQGPDGSGLPPPDPAEPRLTADVGAPPAAGAEPGDGRDYDAHVRALRQRLPHDGFDIVVEPPFVVVGDGGREDVERWAEGTVRWAVTRLKRDYFEKDPADILDIWLFRDARSYATHPEQLFGSRPDTEFGYYSARDRALVMNIATGGGTLVHEIVHPFVAANFPDCPAWLNEGLGSLYEQCGDRDGRIEGRTNWRLAGLQTAIREARLPTFEALTSTTDRAFYDSDPGTNYAQARYLCYWLEQHRLLRPFWHAFRNAHGDDRTGYLSLKRALERDDMAAFQAEWEAYVLALRFDG